jgi:hypothetical protein
VKIINSVGLEIISRIATWFSTKTISTYGVVATLQENLY